MIQQRRVAMIAFSVAVAVTAACAKKPVPEPPVPVVTTSRPFNQDSADNARRMQMRQDSIDRANRLAEERRNFVADSIRRADEARTAAAREMESMRSTLSSTVQFDYDRSDLRDDTRQALDAKIPILTANTGVTIRVAGHTDNRGSGEYNLQLGQRRAAAARDYLIARGVNTQRIELVSYGEERPRCQSEDEGCWAQNRRAEFEITGGGANLRRP